jgi:methionyl-tRNA formyltransferase
LARLLVAGHEIALVLTQPDRPAGRGLQPVASAVKQFAANRGIKVLQPQRLKGAPELETVRAVQPDALVVAAYGLLLPGELLDAGRYGALNIHGSLLPRWRGAAPIQRALLAGDGETGVSIMQMDAGLDTGPVFVQKRIPILAGDDAGTLHDKLAVLGAEAMVEVLDQLEAGRARAIPQPEEGITYAAKIDKRDTRLDWSRPARELERAVRAFRPAPGAFGVLEGEAIKIWQAEVVDIKAQAGTLRVTNERLTVACGQQGLAISELQRAGGRRLSAAQFLRGRPLPPGARFQW